MFTTLAFELIAPFLEPIIIVLIIIQVLIAGAAIYLRYQPRRSEPIVLTGVAPEAAGAIVADFLSAVSDTRVGFPTGRFVISEIRTEPNRVIADEVNFKGSQGLSAIKYILLLPLGLMAIFGRIHWIGGLLGLVAGVVVAFYLIIPIAILGVSEIILRRVLRSRITAELEPSGETGSRVQFVFHGFSAWRVQERLVAALRAPPLPATFLGTAASASHEAQASAAV